MNKLDTVKIRILNWPAISVNVIILFRNFQLH